MTSGGNSPEQAQQQVIDRATSDPDFRSQLLEDPKAAISEHLGIALPAGITVRAIEEQPGEVVLVLPARPMRSGTALSETDLAKAAGGTAVSWLTLNAQCIG
jgi:hypothetical protein